MAISFVQGSGGGGNSASPQRNIGSVTAGNLLAALVAWNAGGGAATAANGFARLTEVSSGDRAALFWKVADAGDTGGGALSPCGLDTAVGWNCSLAEYALASGSWVLDAEAAQVDNDATKTSPSITPTAGVETLLVGGCMSSAAADNPWGSPAIGGSAANERSDLGTNAIASALFDLIVAAASGSYAAQAVAGTANSGSAHLAAFRAATAAATRVPRVSYPKKAPPPAAY